MGIVTSIAETLVGSIISVPLYFYTKLTKSLPMKVVIFELHAEMA